MTADRPGSSDRLRPSPIRLAAAGAGPPRLRLRRASAAVAGLLVGLFCVLLGPTAPASAHAALVASDPAAGTIVPDAPNKVTLTFSESVQLISGRIQVLAPDGSRADQGEPQAAGGTVTVPLRSGGGRGTYLISYRVVSVKQQKYSCRCGGCIETAPAKRNDRALSAGHESLHERH